MTLNIIDMLTQKVSALVLDGESEFVTEKSQALAAFYPIVLTLLKSKPDLIKTLQNQLNPRIADLFSSNSTLKKQFLQHLGGSVPAEQTENTLNRAITPLLSLLENEAGTADSNGLVKFLNSQWGNIQSKLPGWATPLLAGLGVTSLTSAQESFVEPLVSKLKDEKRSSFILPLLALLVLAGLIGFLFKSCSKKPELGSTVVTQPSEGTSPRFQLSTGAAGELENCLVAVNNSGYIDALQNDVKKIFNHTTGCGVDTGEAYGTEFLDQDVLSQLVGAVKGVPNTKLNWENDRLTIQSANPADAEALAAKINPLLKKVKIAFSAEDGVAASSATEVNTAINDSISKAEQALSSINLSNVKADDIAKALNLQIVNFSTASSTIPKENQTVLTKAAELMQKAPQVSLTVEGHTDNTGDAAANKALSLKRAQAVADYLVSQGVDTKRVAAVGFGQEKPTADNTTEAGKFKNRRIEFKVVDTDAVTPVVVE